MPDIKQIPALIKLLDEPDDDVFGKIRGQLLSLGSDARSPLAAALENCFDPIVHERIKSILRSINQASLYSEFDQWLKQGADDLLKGFILVTKTQYPDLDENDIYFRIEQLKVDVWIELHDNLTALENIKVLNHVIFQVNHFDGNRDDLTAPQNSCVNTFLESRKGSPLSLGMLFIILAEKLQLPVYGVNLPQHFILAYVTTPGLKNPTDRDVLFYINPFSKGAVFTRREIEIFISQMKIQPDRSFFAPCTHADIIKRLINSLIFSFKQSRQADKADDLENLLKAFK